jgi:hypothetical protein
MSAQAIGPVFSVTTSLARGLIIIAKVNPNAPRFDDPQCARYRLSFQDGQEVEESVEDALKGCSRSDVQHDYSSASLRRKSGDLAEISIESKERSPLGRANLEQFLVGDAMQALIPHGDCVMAGCL